MTRTYVRSGSLPVLVVASVLLAGTWAEAQSTKAAKDAQKLAQSAEQAETALQEVVSHVQRMLGDYNSILKGSSKNPEAAHKKLGTDLAEARKKIAGVNRAVDSLDERGRAYFAGWDAELERYTTPGVRQKSAERLDAARQRHETMVQSLDRATAAFTPLLESLDDQVLFLGRDLSPDAVASLQEESQAVNLQADDVLDTVEVLLAQARGAEAPPAATVAD